jgi:PKD repeat protein
MKKHLLSAFGFFCLALNITAQEERPANLRHPCNTFEAMEEGFLANPKLKAQFEASQAQFEIDYQKALQDKANNKNAKVAIPTYTIPVVFHIMGPQSVTDQVFVNLVSYFNRDFAMAGSDTTSINPAFKSIFSDSGIRFALAKRDPNGNCTNGIIRHNSDNIYWSQSSPAYNYSGTGTNRWPTNKYLNIYIVECISSMTYSCPTTGGAYIGGYTYLPGSTPYTSNGNMGDAIVLLRNQLAQGNPLDSRTISHEIGHWLNLLHTFGSSNNPKFNSPSDPGPSSCTSDQVNDTPPTGGYFSFCPAATTYTRDCSNLPNYENIMDYASCPKMFTDGQIARMTTALNSSTGGRNNLWTASNYTATGISSAFTCSPVANFISNKSNACTGATVTYTSTSFVGNSGGVSWVFQGGTPSTSTSTLQVVTYATPGTYSVSITATNSTGSNVKNATSYVNVVNGTGGNQVPLVADFEGATLPSSITVTNENAGSPGWIQHASNGANSTSKSIYINNASSSSTGGHIDYFETPIYDFTGTTGITLSYYYAYAKRTATQADTFKVQYSLDCGGIWSNVLGIPNTAAMATASGGTTTVAFTPTSSQWIYKNIVSSLLNTLNNKPSVKFRFWFKSDMVVGRSNNIYIDQININGNVVTGITELEKSMQMVIYPNPTSSSSNIEFTLSENQSAKISVVDLMGRTLEETSKTAGNNGLINYTINANNQLAAGVYFVNIDVNNQRISKKLIIE